MNNMMYGQTEKLSITGDGLTLARECLDAHIEAVVMRSIALGATGGTVTMSMTIELNEVDDGLLGVRYVPTIKHDIKSVLKFEERDKGLNIFGNEYRIEMGERGVMLRRLPEEEHQISLDEVDNDGV